MNLEKVWKTALKDIKESVPASSFQAWIKSANLISLENNKATLEVRNEFSRNLLIQNYYRVISKALETSSGVPVNLIIQVNSNLPHDYIPSLSSIAEDLPNNTSPNGSLKIIPNSGLSSSNGFLPHNLNPKFVFDNFIVGGHNQFCHAAALAIAEGRSEGAYNPFFIYGEVGLGKTHIMQSIGNYLRSKKPQAKVLYLSAEKFLNDLISSMRKSKMNEFRNRYRSLDLLLIDDIQFIEGKETTQEEFFHTFNALKDNGSQIILTSDRPPKAISKLEPRLCSRFEGGLLADVQSPTYETRLAILARKAEILKIKLKPDIADLIAQCFPENVRRLEGALVKLQAYVNFTSRPLTMELTKKVLGIDIAQAEIISAGNKDLTEEDSNLKSGENTDKMLKKIAEAVAEKLQVTSSKIFSRDNTQEVKNARQICMAIARSAGLSMQDISLGFDGRGNSSILNSCRRVRKEAKNDKELNTLLTEIEAQIKL